MTISDKDRKLLWGRSRNLCAFPQCRQPLTANQHDAASDEAFETVLGEEAHIRSAKPSGPRHDPTFPTHKIDSYDNLILLCRVHHRLIDDNGGRAYDVQTLVRMRTGHEQREERRVRISHAIESYVADRFQADDKVLFEQVELHGPRVDAMFVDVPFATRHDTAPARLLRRIAADHPGDDKADGFAITGAAQAILHPDWSGNALLVGGPGQGKTTLLQFVCQYHRARRLGRNEYTGQQQKLQPVVQTAGIPIRLDLRNYVRWAVVGHSKRTSKRAESAPNDPDEWPSIERYIVYEIKRHSGGHDFALRDLATLLATESVLLALDGLDEIANLDHRERVSEEIVRTNARLHADALRLVVLVATRPGGSTSSLWSSREFPIFHLRRLTAGLRLQYLQRWSRVAGLNPKAAAKLQQTFLENEELPHIRELASYPMQLAILLHLLQRRGLLPQQRTELYQEYLKTFLDREEGADKEPLLSTDREVIEDIHAFLGWHLQSRAEADNSSRTVSRSELKELLAKHLEGHDKGQELASRLFSAIETRVLCLVEREPGTFQFEVQSLQEYFAARYIFEYAPTKGEGNSRDDCLDALLARPYWSNVCRFFVGMFSKVEVRGIRHNLTRLTDSPHLAVHPHLRATAVQLLDDRTYLGQPDAAIREVVDYILAGPGVVLGEDGFLDDAREPLSLSEDAGRAQTIQHLQGRLEGGLPRAVASAAAAMLRRHASDTASVLGWWWQRFEATPDWFRTSSDLGVFRGLGPEREAQLAFLVGADLKDVWSTELLLRGGYDGGSDPVVTACIAEINEGALSVLHARSGGSLDRLVLAGVAAVGARGTSEIASPGVSNRQRARLRRTEGRQLLANVVEQTEVLRSPSPKPEDAAGWATRLRSIDAIWGDGWIARHAVSRLPAKADIDAIARGSEDQSALASTLKREADARRNRADPDWWLADLKSAGDWRASFWLYSLLAVAHASTVVQSADMVSDVVDRLNPRQFRTLRAHLVEDLQHRKLPVQDALRLDRVAFSPRALWLLASVSTEATVEQIAKKLETSFPELLTVGCGDMRPLIRLVGRAKTVKPEALRNARHALPAGGWAGHIKLRKMSVATATEILNQPHDWPSDLIIRAIQRTSRPLMAAPAVGKLAAMNRWFQIT